MEGDNQLDIVVIDNGASGEIVGLVPIRKTTIFLPFLLGGRALYRTKLDGILLLGSEPMMCHDAETVDKLFLQLSHRHPCRQAIQMDAVPLGSDLWRHLSSSYKISREFSVHVLHGFQDCHAVDVPTSIEEYYRKYSKKRRYNLLRQERLLREHFAQPLELTIVEKEQDVGALMHAMKTLKLIITANCSHTELHYGATAKHGLLRCFILKSGETVIGVALGMKSKRTYRIQKFHHNHTLEKLSPGTTLWQLVIRHIIAEGQYSRIDMGYGTPTYRYSATNAIEKKGKIILLRKSLANRARIFAHSRYTLASNLFRRTFRYRD